MLIYVFVVAADIAFTCVNGQVITLTDNSGSLRSPNYPNDNYPNNLNCYVKILPSNGQVSGQEHMDHAGLSQGSSDMFALCIIIHLDMFYNIFCKTQSHTLTWMEVHRSLLWILLIENCLVLWFIHFFILGAFSPPHLISQYTSSFLCPIQRKEFATWDPNFTHKPNVLSTQRSWEQWLMQSIW